MEEPALQLLARPMPDGSYRARIFEGGVMTWQCEHRHETIEAAWDCAKHRARSLRDACSIESREED